jgi:4-hydroxybenzoyl-CoA thioesterase
MSWVRSYPLKFAHCDPAGIAYYPKLLELLDGAIEDWTAEVIGVSRHLMHRDLARGMPTVTLSARFDAVSFHGDELRLTLDLASIGRSSVDFSITARCIEECRFTVDYRQVLVDLVTRSSAPWPDSWRERLEMAR